VVTTTTRAVSHNFRADGASMPRQANLDAIRAALEAAGIEFTNGDGPGVRLRKGGK
jgi:hypothetical protein